MTGVSRVKHVEISSMNATPRSTFESAFAQTSGWRSTPLIESIGRPEKSTGSRVAAMMVWHSKSFRQPYSAENCSMIDVFAMPKVPSAMSGGHHKPLPAGVKPIARTTRGKESPRSIWFVISFSLKAPRLHLRRRASPARTLSVATASSRSSSSRRPCVQRSLPKSAAQMRFALRKRFAVRCAIIRCSFPGFSRLKSNRRS